jgi:hypothetical protein
MPRTWKKPKPGRPEGAVNPYRTGRTAIEALIQPEVKRRYKHALKALHRVHWDRPDRQQIDFRRLALKYLLNRSKRWDKRCADLERCIDVDHCIGLERCIDVDRCIARDMGDPSSRDTSKKPKVRSKWVRRGWGVTTTSEIEQILNLRSKRKKLINS